MTPVIWIAPSVYEPKGRQVAMQWSAFAARVENPKEGRAKEALPRWAPVEFRGAHRSLANVIRAHAVVADVDQGVALGPLADVLGDLYAIVHTTWSATPDAPRWRVVLPLDRPVDADEYRRVWRSIAVLLEKQCVAVDHAACHAAVCWAVPVRPPSGFYCATTTKGAVVDVTAALAEIPPSVRLPPPTCAERTDSYGRRRERAAAYLAAMPGAIQGSRGSDTTFRAAVAMVCGFALDADDALQLLAEVHNPLCQPAWTLAELRHKVRQAVQRGRLEHGYLAARRARCA